jgi:hypothetical protein
MNDNPEIPPPPNTPGELEPFPLRLPWLRSLLPLLLGAGILYYVLHGQHWTRIVAAFARCDWPLFLLGAGIYTFGYFLLDVASNHLVWNWFVVRMRLSEMLKLRGAMMLLQSTLAPMASLATILYMMQKKHLRAFPSFSPGLFLAYCDGWAYTSLLALALCFRPEMKLIVFLLVAVLFLDQLFWTAFFIFRLGRRFWPRLYHHPISLAFRAATLGQYGRLTALRLLWPLLQVLGQAVALRAMGMAVPLPVIIAVTLCMTMTTYLPVSAGGLGAPNWVALYYMPYANSDIELVTAYSLLFQFCFLAGRLLIGTSFFYSFWQEVLRDHRDELVHIHRVTESEDRH